MIHSVMKLFVGIAVVNIVRCTDASEKKPATTVADASSDDDDDVKKFASLVDWIRTNGGRVDERLGIGWHVHNNNNDDGGVLVRGAIALDDIPAHVELFFSPWKLVLGTQDGDSSKVLSNDKCKILQQYAQEVQKGKESFWFHYLAMDDSLSASIPMLWSNAVLDELQGLPPGDKFDSSLVDWFSTSCHGAVPFDNLDQATRQSLLAAVTRSAASMRFLPLFDLLNHHNGLVNVESNANQDGNTITTTRKIEKGQAIFISYRGGGREATSSEIFRRYGFVEDWPQQWTWISSSGGNKQNDDNDDDSSGQQQPPQFNEERFLVFPNGLVTLYPTAEMLASIGTTSLLPLLDLAQAHGGSAHNNLLSSAQLMHFYEAGSRLLKSLATSVQEDVILLNERETTLATSHQAKRSAFNNQQDLIHARHQIEATKYRLEFKKAIEMGIRTAKSCLENRQRQEL